MMFPIDIHRRQNLPLAYARLPDRGSKSLQHQEDRFYLADLGDTLEGFQMKVEGICDELECAIEYSIEWVRYHEIIIEALLGWYSCSKELRSTFFLLY